MLTNAGPTISEKLLDVPRVRDWMIDSLIMSEKLSDPPWVSNWMIDGSIMSEKLLDPPQVQMYIWWPSYAWKFVGSIICRIDLTNLLWERIFEVDWRWTYYGKVLTNLSWEEIWWILHGMAWFNEPILNGNLLDLLWWGSMDGWLCLEWEFDRLVICVKCDVFDEATSQHHVG